MKKAAVPSILIAILLAVAVIVPRAAAEEVSADRVSMAGQPTSESTDSEAIRQALRELGYIEGQNIAFEYRYAEGKPDRFPELAAELVRLKVGHHRGSREERSGRRKMRPDDSHCYGGRADPAEASPLKALPVPAATSPVLQASIEN